MMFTSRKKWSSIRERANTVAKLIRAVSSHPRGGIHLTVTEAPA